MTEKETIKHIIRTRKFPKTFDDWTNYVFLIVPIGFVAIGFSMIYNYVKFNSRFSILLASILFIILGIAFTFFILKRFHDNITFKVISPIKEDGIDSIAERINSELKLKRIDINKDLGRIIAFTKITAFSWGEQLTLIFDKDCILINSKPSSQPFTILKGRQNIKRLEQIL